MMLPVKTITEHAHNLYRMSSNRNDKTEIVLKVALNTINQNQTYSTLSTREHTYFFLLYITEETEDLK
jgi:hypothetical protein